VLNKYQSYIFDCVVETDYSSEKIFYLSEKYHYLRIPYDLLTDWEKKDLHSIKMKLWDLQE